MTKNNDDYVMDVVKDNRIACFTEALVGVGLLSGFAIVVLCDRIAHVKIMQKKLRWMNPRIVRGNVKRKDREKIIEDFESGKCSLIIASSVFTKGVNIKRISMVVDVAQRKNKNDSMQKLGRSLRLHKDKKKSLYFDLWNSKSKNTIDAMKSRRTSFKRGGMKIHSVQVKGNNFWKEAKKLIADAEHLSDSGGNSGT
jgi:superfamily II DNA or RNA helicase